MTSLAGGLPLLHLRQTLPNSRPGSGGKKMLKTAYKGIPLRELVGLNAFKTLIAARPRAAAAGSGRPPPLPKNLLGRKINLEAIQRQR